MFSEYSIISNIQASDPTFPSDYMEFTFNQTDQYSKQQGYIRFSKTSKRTEEMTFSGFIEFEEKLNHVDLDNDKIVNPYLYLYLSQIDFNAVLVQN